MAGSKRKPPGKVTKAPSDFKRLKAKVGSKARKPLNETDTNFKRASIFIAGKTIGACSTGSILSQKGKSLLDLSLQASHPAVLARQSALKGLLNILAEYGPNQLRAHIHVFVQIASAGLVDEDSNVRRVGCSLLEQILGKYDELTLSPFLPLIIAYICSGLHSLDRNMRVDGAHAADIVCSFFRATMSVEDAGSILPPFIGLLADHRGASLQVVLRALVKVLGIASSNNDKHNAHTMSFEKSADFIYQKGSRSRTAFFYPRRVIQSAPEFDTLKNVFSNSTLPWTSLTAEVVDDKKQRAGKPSHCSVLVGIQKKLCDVLVEVMDSDSVQTQEREKFVTMKVATAAVQAMYLSTRAYKNDANPSIVGHEERIISTLFDLFPLNIRLSVGSKGEAQETEICNALITKVLLLFEVITECREQSRMRMNTLFSYWIPSGNSEESSLCHVDVYRELLVVFSENPKRFSSYRKRILSHLYCAYLLAPLYDVARSVSGRKAAVILAKGCLEEVQLNAAEQDEKLVTDITTALPTYLKMWSSEFQEESLVILRSMYLIVCTNARNGCDKVTLERMSPLFEKSHAEISTFEALSRSARPPILGIIRLVGQPSRTILKRLSILCSMDGPADSCSIGGIYGLVYSLRKSISMTDYLGFVVTSIGVQRTIVAHSESMWSNHNFLTFITSLDYRVTRGAKAAVECGSRKALKMLEPQLLSWMADPSDGTSLSRAFVLRCRVSIGFIAIILMELAKADISVKTDTELQGLLERCAVACGHVICFLVRSDGIGLEIEDMMLAPIVAWTNVDGLFKIWVRRAISHSVQEPRLSEFLLKLDNLGQA